MLITCLIIYSVVSVSLPSAVGLQSIVEDDVTVEEIGIPADVQVWVLNESTQVFIMCACKHN